MSKTSATVKDILSFFPPGRKPRDIQIDVLKKVEALWDTTDVFVVCMPTGTGKSFTSYTLARYAAHRDKKGANIIVPNNLLVGQYNKDFPALHSLARKDAYTCTTLARDGCTGKDSSCESHKKYLDSYCSGCPYLMAVRKAFSLPYGVYNFYTYMAYKLYKPTLIVDEAHTLVPVLQDMNSKKLWKHEYHYPHWVTTYGSLNKWLDSLPQPLTPLLAKLKDFLGETGIPRYVVEQGTDLYRGEERELLKLVPVDTRDAPPIFWPTGKVRKVILLSATFGAKDLEQLGLAGRRVAIIDVGSPIEASQRPVVVENVVSMSYSNRSTALPLITSRIEELMTFHEGEKGLIHVPYSLAEALASSLAGHKRLLFHGREDKKEVFAKFRESAPEEGKVLIACGMWEGIDLPYEEGRWQVIAKVPWPSLAEPAVAYLAKEDEEWYLWQTLKTVMQGCGRVCRGADDYGVTYILDGTFQRLMDKSEAIMPKWFKDAIVTQ